MALGNNLLFLILLALAAIQTSASSSHTPLTFVTTFCGGESSRAAVHVLSESLIRAGHREGLTVFTSANSTPDEVNALRSIPLVTVIPAPSIRTYCQSDTSRSGECGHMRLTIFGASKLSRSSNVIYISHDSVVLSDLNGLRDADPFSAVRATHSDGFALDILVMRRDHDVAETLRMAFCAGEKTDAEVLRLTVPNEVWSAIDDRYSVPADQLDTSWYKQKGMTPKIVRFAEAPRPWRWWTEEQRFSLVAGAHWCEAAAHTPYSCGWGTEELLVTNETVPIPLRAPGQPTGASTASKFAVLLSTYRRPTWRALVKHYASMKIVSKVVLVWHDPDTDAPSGQEFGMNVIVVRPDRDSLNNRFVTPEMGLPEAVYVCDDDMWVLDKSLQHAFGVWQGNTRRLVGLFPRKWGNGPVRYSTKVSEGYNVALTKGVFVHRAFLFMYERLLPERVKDIVDEHKNCEDLLMNIMVSRYTGLAPLHVVVEEQILDLGHHGGISKRGSHFLTRSKCVDDIVSSLGIHGWEPPIMTGSMSVRPLKNREIK